MPGLLKKIDDPWGITWRVVRLARGFSLRRSIRFAAGLLMGRQFDRPVFIIGASRSGTTTLSHLLRLSPELGSLRREGHNLWLAFHHPRYSGWTSDSVGPGQVRPGERRFVQAYLYSYFPQHRFVEKTPENTFRIPYLLDLFPDARFLVLKRDPCDVLNSLINGWRHPTGRFRLYFLPEDLSIPGYGHRRGWCFTLFDGWREFKSSPIPEIAFAQWAEFTRAIAAARDMVPAGQHMEVCFEHLLAGPESTMRRICEFAQVEFEPVRPFLGEALARPANPLSPPAPDKWRNENHLEISQLLPRIRELAPLIGYEIVRSGGDWAARPVETCP
ncbi:MAG: sulfotransferase [Candidatus Hodarchaeota archaeon]